MMWFHFYLCLLAFADAQTQVIYNVMSPSSSTGLAPQSFSKMLVATYVQLSTCCYDNASGSQGCRVPIPGFKLLDAPVSVPVDVCTEGSLTCPGAANSVVARILVVASACDPRIGNCSLVLDRISNVKSGQCGYSWKGEALRNCGDITCSWNGADMIVQCNSVNCATQFSSGSCDIDYNAIFDPANYVQ